ncbi:S8 family serine peptidase [Halobacteriovorax sp.]|uniref:S8 family serine peptidase n=1 Tax=Halobacteriovorax sp. TaxID=2020862 RepID=UPI0035613313
MKLFTLILLSALSINSFSSTVAILDNGVDYTHKDLTQNIYRNHVEKKNGKDDDQNGYIDDILGWNFVKMNNEVFDFTREIYLTEDIERYYFLRAKKSLGTISEVETDEYDELRKDSDLKKRRSDFVSWMHGTHVAGIAANTEMLPKELHPNDIEVISITYLGSAEYGPALAPSFERTSSSNIKEQKRHIKNYWNSFLAWQLNKFKLGVDYASSKASVVNGSFGQSFEGIQDRMKSYYKKQFHHEMSESDSFDETKKFMNKLIRETTNILKNYPDTLFVFSAGNKKNDSDKYIHFPSAVRLNNILSVGASFDYKEMAYFSNYGKKTVDIFAPGMAIRSTIPRQDYLRTNGTSQAAPFVSNVAVKALAQANLLGIKITINQLKKIILETSLKKDDLKLKSVSEGIIFPERVYQAIRYLKKYSINKAINKSLKKYPTKEITANKHSDHALLIELPTN